VAVDTGRAAEETTSKVPAGRVRTAPGCLDLDENAHLTTVQPPPPAWRRSPHRSQRAVRLDWRQTGQTPASTAPRRLVRPAPPARLSTGWAVAVAGRPCVRPIPGHPNRDPHPPPELPTGWWFLRYPAPSPTLRLRVPLREGEFAGAAHDLALWAERPHGDGLVADCALATYRPETRHGTGTTLTAAEKAFAAGITRSSSHAERRAVVYSGSRPSPASAPATSYAAHLHGPRFRQEQRHQRYP
jgi:hypothetical protein